jgi:hypothetical protein
MAIADPPGYLMQAISFDNRQGVGSFKVAITQWLLLTDISTTVTADPMTTIDDYFGYVFLFVGAIVWKGIGLGQIYFLEDFWTKNIK